MNLEEEIKKLKPEIEDKIKERLKEIQKKKTSEGIMMELFFCIIVANNSIKNGECALNNIGKNLFTLKEDDLKEQIKNTAKRFYNRKSEYLIEAREKEKLLLNILERDITYIEKREEIVKNFKGIGYKEASHFFRNIGYSNFAILDRHVLKILKKSEIIEEIPKCLTKIKYLEIEEELTKITEKLKINHSELDGYIFYLSSGRIFEH